eukprot:12034114-Prorocentrum_lima.AAC.1
MNACSRGSNVILRMAIVTNVQNFRASSPRPIRACGTILWPSNQNASGLCLSCPASGVCGRQHDWHFPDGRQAPY